MDREVHKVLRTPRFMLVAGLIGMALTVVFGWFTLNDNRPVHLFILTGQSNMANSDPAESFTPLVEEALSEASVVVVKAATSGMPIRRWYNKVWYMQWPRAKEYKMSDTGMMYDLLMERIREAVDGRPLNSVTLIWMQGERDAFEGYGSLYADSFHGFLDALRQDLGHDEINFVIGRIGASPPDDTLYPDWQAIREVQVSLGESGKHASWVDTDDIPLQEDGIHYEDPEGYRVLLQRFAEEALRLLGSHTPALKD